MLEYLVMLLTVTLIITSVIILIKNRIPLRARIIYGMAGISFALGAIFPVIVSTLTPGQALVTYFGSIALSAAALGHIERKKMPAGEKTPMPLRGTTVNEENSPAIDREPPLIDLEKTPVMDEITPVAVEEAPPQKGQPTYGHQAAEEIPPSRYGNIFEEAAPGKEAVATEAVGTYPCGEPYIPILVNEEIKEPDVAVVKTGPGTVNDCISAGFEAKARNNPAGAAACFFKALHMNQGPRISLALVLEISAAYQELGQHRQAGMILNSFMEQEYVSQDSSLRQRLQGQLVYLETLVELLRIAKMPNAPYSKIPNLIKIKAGLETNEKLKEITKGGRVSEEQPADFRATGS